MQHEQSGLSVRAFCRKQGIGEHSFYIWRKRLADAEPVRFALVERESATEQKRERLELIFANGERLQIPAGVDAGSLRTVLDLLREVR